MNVEIGTEAAQFPEKEYRKGIFVAVRIRLLASRSYMIVSRASNYGPDVLLIYFEY